MSKIARTESVAMLPESLLNEARSKDVEQLQHPRKTPIPSATCTPLTTKTMQNVLTGEAAEGSVLDGMEGERTQTSLDSKAKNAEPPSVSDIIKKLRRDTGTYNFIPLSTGKYMSEVWWEPYDCYISETKRFNGIPWLIISTRIFIDVAGKTMDIWDKNMEVKFRCSPEEVLKICYLKDKYMKELHSERVQTYEMWNRTMYQLCRFEECAHETEFAKRVYDYVSGLVITRIPGKFRLFFSKRSHPTITGIEDEKSEPNLNSVLCRAIGKVEFNYEFKIRLFLISEEKKNERVRKAEEEQGSQIF